ncbi:ROK family protein [Martelella mediterranea]|uniref:Glucokinase n=1 Tax=Martelella mediterranea DSM 17316 TaxID=1122214 RepID=A0A1U9Z9K3_9HYPH|nr:ROK family protein [Martelella mediterranea]AQZ54375.1 Glucokinase [Martelella mediterranea DSM 17316]
MSITEKTVLDDPASFAASAETFSIIAQNDISRAALARATGLSRMTLGQRLAPLIESDLVVELRETVPSGGRPTKMLGINPDLGLLLAADIGETTIRLAVLNVQGTILHRETLDYRPEDGAEPALRNIANGFDTMLSGLPDRPFLIGLSVSLPAPIDVKVGLVVGPSILRGWDNFQIVPWLERRLGIPVFVENDVNLMTLYESRRAPEAGDDFFFIKMGTGIGSGLIADGHLYHGANGASGDIGHIQLNREKAPLCRCGKVGCLEAHAAGWAIARELRASGFEAEDAHDVIRLIDQHVPEAIGLLREAGRALGEVVADVVSILNPRTIRIGSTLAAAQEYLLAGVRERVYQRCLPLATNNLIIEAAPPNEIGCLTGAALLLKQKVFTRDGSERLLKRYQEWRLADFDNRRPTEMQKAE